MLSALSSIIDWIIAFFNAFFSLLIDLSLDLLVIVINLVLGVLAFLIQLMASIMPSLSLGLDLINQFPSPHQAICWINWIFPVDVLFQCTQFYIGLYVLKFFSGPILRFLKITN